jgi:hypothetical protein
MKKLVKIFALVLSLTMILTLSACGGGAKAEPAEVYNCQSDFVEAGYEGDCISTIASTLVLNSDGSYTLVSNFFVNQVSGVVVFFTTNYYTGTYTVDSEADGVKTVTLSDATHCVSNMNGTATTSDEDSSLLEDGAGQTVTCDTATLTLTLAE